MSTESLNQEVLSEKISDFQEPETTGCSKTSFATLKTKFNKIRSLIPNIIYDAPAFEEISSELKKYTLFIHPHAPQNIGSRSSKKSISLPSHFPESLLYQTLALESPLKDQIDIKFTTNFHQSPTESIPFLLTPEGKPVVGTQLTNILIYGSENKNDAEFELDLQTRASINLAETALGDALLYFYFFDTEYFEEITQPLIAAGLPWLIRIITGYNARQAVQSTLECRYNSINLKDILSAASEALNILEIQLNDSSKSEEEKEINEDMYFLGGKSPSILDFTVFAYFHLMIASFGDDHPLRKLASGFPNLKAHSLAIFSRVYKKPKSTTKE